MERVYPKFELSESVRCLVKVALPSYKQTNIGPKTFYAVFIGYAQNSAAYRFMSWNDYSISVHRDVEFFEHVFPLKKKVSNVTSDSACD